MQSQIVVAVAGWLVGWWLLWRVPTLGDDRASPRAPEQVPQQRSSAAGTTVVVPARNEASRLPGLLSGLRRQVPAAGQVVVVDDGSDDGTDGLARDGGAEVVAGAALPAGWTGKNWACHQGVQAARGGRLVFLDADVSLADGALSALLREHDDRGGLVSVQPYHRIRRWYERLSALFNVIGFMGVGAASPGRRGRSQGAFGPCLVCWRDDYDTVGGHAGVREAITEDVALAHRFEAAGLPVATLGGGKTVSFRMYPDGLGQLVEGWSKNFATGAGSIRRTRLLLVVFWVAAMLVSLQLVLRAATDVGLTTSVVAVGAYGAFVLQTGVMLRQLGGFGRATPFGYPVLVVAFLAVFVRSLWFTLVRRRVTWRGRTVPLGASDRTRVASGSDRDLA